MDRVITDKTTLEDLKKPIDWKNVDKILNEKLEISRQFLLDALCK